MISMIDMSKYTDQELEYKLSKQRSNYSVSEIIEMKAELFDRRERYEQNRKFTDSTYKTEKGATKEKQSTFYQKNRQNDNPVNNRNTVKENAQQTPPHQKNEAVKRNNYKNTCEEEKIEKIRYITSLLTFYMKGEFVFNPNSITLVDPNSILGLIPLGAKKESIAVTQISSTQSNFKVQFKPLFFGVVVSILSFLTFNVSSILGFVLLVFAANFLLNAFEVNLQINLTSGKKRYFEFFIFEKSKAEKAEKKINAMISARLNDTNNRLQTDRIVDAINRS